MKHYIWFMEDGTMGGTHVIYNGFDAHNADPSSGTCTHPTSLNIKSIHADNPKYSGMVGFLCECDMAEGPFCQCADERVDDSYVDTATKTIRAKPLVKMSLDGVEYTDSQIDPPIDKAPGSIVRFKLVGPEVPDGVSVSAPRNRAGVDLCQTYPVTLTFSHGATNEISLVVPLQGMIGYLGFYHARYMRRVILALRGWNA